MSIFDKVKKPIFLKEDNDLRQYVDNLNALREKTSGKLRNKIEKEHKIASIGLYGEDNVAFELKNCNLGMYVIRDLHIQNENQSAQIDFVVVTKKFALLIECKNLIGDIEIDNKGNFIRTYTYNNHKIREGIYSPITQNQRHLDVLRNLKREEMNNPIRSMIMEYNFDNNYQSIVVLANPKTILKDRYAPKVLKEQVIRSDQIGHYIQKIYNESKAVALSEKAMLRWAENLLERHQPAGTDYLLKYEKLLEQEQSMETKIKDSSNVINKQEPISTEMNDKTHLYNELKTYRLNKSRKDKVKPYVIFTNKELDMLIKIRPQNEAELLKVNGFGPVKVSKYGQEILQLINNE